MTDTLTLTRQDCDKYGLDFDALKKHTQKVERREFWVTAMRDGHWQMNTEKPTAYISFPVREVLPGDIPSMTKEEARFALRKFAFTEEGINNVFKAVGLEEK